MSGTLYLGCGSAAAEAALWRLMLHRPVTKIIYWPFALPPTMCSEADTWLRHNLDALAVDYYLETWQSLVDHRPADLDPRRTDLLFVGGGNTFQLLDHVRAHGFVEAVGEYWDAGGDYYGGSAGAVLACDSIEVAEGHDANDVGLGDLTSLGLLAGIAVLPHFSDDELSAALGWTADHRTALLGLPESAGLYCAAGRATVVGRGQVTQVVDGTVVRHEPGHGFSVHLR